MTDRPNYYYYHVTQRDGAMSTECSPLSPDEFIKSYLNAGVGLKRIRISKNSNWPLIYDVSKEEFVQKYGRPDEKQTIRE